MQLRAGHGRILWVTLLVLLVIGAALSLAPGGERDPDLVWAQGEADLKSGRFDRSEAALVRLARLRAPNSLDWMLRAQVALARNRTDDAIAALHRIPDDTPIAPQARLLEGQAELRRARIPAAERALLAAVALDPKQVQAHRELIYIYGMQMRRADLNDQFRALSDLAPLTFDNVFHWVLTRNNEWEARELLLDLERFLKADPNDKWSRVALAECLRRLSRVDEAEAALAALPPNDPEALAVRARIAMNAGDNATAKALLSKGPADHPELARLRGRIGLSEHDFNAALEAYRISYAKEPDSRDTIFGMANALRALGRKDEAAPFVEASRDYDALGSLLERSAAPEGRQNRELLRQLGAACEKIARLREARAWYKLVIASNPLDHDAQQALFRIDQKLAQEQARASR